jgi:hypothetical protein
VAKDKPGHRNTRVLVCIGRENKDSRTNHPSDEVYREADLVLEVHFYQAADRICREIEGILKRRGFVVRSRCDRSYVEGPDGG